MPGPGAAGYGGAERNPPRNVLGRLFNVVREGLATCELREPLPARPTG